MQRPQYPPGPNDGSGRQPGPGGPYSGSPAPFPGAPGGPAGRPGMPRPPSMPAQGGPPPAGGMPRPGFPSRPPGAPGQPGPQAGQRPAGPPGAPGARPGAGPMPQRAPAMGPGAPGGPRPGSAPARPAQVGAPGQPLPPRGAFPPGGPARPGQAGPGMTAPPRPGSGPTGPPPTSMAPPTGGPPRPGLAGPAPGGSFPGRGPPGAPPSRPSMPGSDLHARPGAPPMRPEFRAPPRPMMRPGAPPTSGPPTSGPPSDESGAPPGPRGPVPMPPRGPAMGRGGPPPMGMPRGPSGPPPMGGPPAMGVPPLKPGPPSLGGPPALGGGPPALGGPPPSPHSGGFAPRPGPPTPGSKGSFRGPSGGAFSGGLSGTSQPGAPSPELLAAQLEAISLGPDAPGAPDATDPSLFPRPLMADGELAPTEAQLMAPQPPADAASCDPRVIRPVVTAIPNSMSLKSSWHLPLALVLQPLADLPKGSDVQTVDGSKTNAILRCGVCRSYVNPYNRWTNGGRSFQCCICGSQQELPEGMYIPINADGRPHADCGRAELTAGSIEYIASAEYTVRAPMPPCYCFVLDVSQHAVASGLLAAACAAIAASLDGLTARNSVSRIGFIAYDSAVHFFNLNGAAGAPQMMTVGDLDDPFPPLPDDHYVTLDAARAVVDGLLQALPQSFEGTSVLDTAMGSALQAAYRMISHLGGKLLLFCSAACTLGVGPTKNRDAPAHYNSDRESGLRNPADPFFLAFANECTAAQISVDIFAASSQYLDLFSLAAIPRQTGGSVYYYPGFAAPRDGRKLAAELAHNLGRTTGWEAVMRLRCSKGVRIASFHGHLHVRSNDLVALPSISSDDTIVAQLALEDSVVAGGQVYVQCAVLYTNSQSERRIRVHTLALPVVGGVFEMFEGADALACAGALGKLAIDRARKVRLTETRELLEGKFGSQLQEFKALHQSTFRGASRLGYPRTLRAALPWTHGLLRSAALRGAADVNADERCALMSLLMTAPLEVVALVAYPAVFPLHAAGWGHTAADGTLALPPTVPASAAYLEQHGAYLVDAGHISFVWVGQLASPELVQDLFGPQGAQHAAQGGLARLSELLLDDLPSGATLGDRARALLAARRAGRVVWPLCFTAVQATGSEGYFASYFVEDRLPPHSQSYHEFLSGLHRRTSVR
eukprot:jgi/Ulvmu1/12784/UM097_0011.1